MNRPPTVLDDLWDDIPVTPAPVDVLLADAQAMARRRRTGVVAAVAAAVFVIAAGTLGVQAATTGGTEDRIADQTPAAPAGTRFVGTGRVVVAVPASWSIQELGCGRLIRHAVYFPPPAGPPCAGLGGAMSSLGVGFPPSSDPAATMTRTTSVDGHEVLATPVSCADDKVGSCWQTIGVPDLDAWFSTSVTAKDGGADQVRTILDSLTVLDEGHAAIPNVPLTLPARERPEAVEQVRAALEAAGFQVVLNPVECPDTGLCASGVLGTTPDAGSVAALGSTVTIDVIDPEVASADPDTDGAGSDLSPTECLTIETGQYPRLRRHADTLLGGVAERTREVSSCEDTGQPAASVRVSVYQWDSRRQARDYLRQAGVTFTEGLADPLADGTQVTTTTVVDELENRGDRFVYVSFTAPR